METQQRRLRRPGRSGRCLDRFKFYPDDQGDRDNLQEIEWKPLSHDVDDRSDPNVSPKCAGYSKIQCSVFQKCVSKGHNKHERVETKLLHQCMVQLAAQFPYKPILHYAYVLFKENNSGINRLPFGLYALFYSTPAKMMLPPQAQTVQYRFLGRSRRLYGNCKLPLSC